MSKIRLLAKTKNGTTKVKALIKHPMSVAGDFTPAHFINELTCTHEDKVVMSANLSVGISMNPFFSFKFKGGSKGDKVTLSFNDNQGNTGSKTTKIR
jgi:sulfur-oxidizing protein SoxZ